VISFQSLEGGYWRQKNTSTKSTYVDVSNPWREAIEDTNISFFIITVSVSNPWREAIEEGMTPKESYDETSFQSLEGGYWRSSTRQRSNVLKVSNPWREAIEVAGLWNVQTFMGKFPILGGRLLKGFRHMQQPPCCGCFQSLEGGYWRRCGVWNMHDQNLFPILRGRLLKRCYGESNNCQIFVSNP